VKSLAWTDAADLSSTTCYFIRGARFFAFDLLMADGYDLRMERLNDRKQELRRLLSRSPASRLQYVDHVHEHGTALFERVQAGLGGYRGQARLSATRDRGPSHYMVQDQESRLLPDGRPRGIVQP